MTAHNLGHRGKKLNPVCGLAVCIKVQVTVTGLNQQARWPDKQANALT